MVATDLDGTLLGPDGRIAPGDVAALHAAAAAGVHLVVATGRPARWLGCLEPIAGARPHVIVSNGAAVVDLASGVIVRRHPLPRATLTSLADALRTAFPGVLLALEHGEVFGCEPGWVSAFPDTSRTTDTENAVTVRAPFEELLDRVTPVVKLLALAPAAGPVGDVDAFADAAAHHLGERAVVTHSVLPGHRALLEISAPGVSKASALAELCAERDVAPAHVAAFGDMPNDLALLEFAGRPFAMGNAHPTLRARFEVVGTNADGGVGTTLTRLLAEADDLPG
nr:HAD-IIB family hydrolase [Propioniciclava soli]